MGNHSVSWQIRLRAFSYKPGNQAGSVTGTNSVVFIWETSSWLTGMNSRNKTKMLEHKLVLFAIVITLWTWLYLSNKANSHTPKVEIHTRPKFCHFAYYVVRAKLFCLKSFVPVTGLEYSYRKIFLPITRISLAKTKISVTGQTYHLIWTHQYFYKKRVARRDLENRASPVDQAHMKRPWVELFTTKGQVCLLLRHIKHNLNRNVRTSYQCTSLATSEAH